VKKPQTHLLRKGGSLLFFCFLVLLVMEVFFDRCDVAATPQRPREHTNQCSLCFSGVSLSTSLHPHYDRPYSVPLKTPRGNFYPDPPSRLTLLLSLAQLLKVRTDFAMSRPSSKAGSPFGHVTHWKTSIVFHTPPFEGSTFFFFGEIGLVVMRVDICAPNQVPGYGGLRSMSCRRDP